MFLEKSKNIQELRKCRKSPNILKSSKYICIQAMFINYANVEKLVCKKAKKFWKISKVLVLFKRCLNEYVSYTILTYLYYCIPYTDTYGIINVTWYQIYSTFSHEASYKQTFSSNFNCEKNKDRTNNKNRKIQYITKSSGNT